MPWAIVDTLACFVAQPMKTGHWGNGGLLCAGVLSSEQREKISIAQVHGGGVTMI